MGVLFFIYLDNLYPNCLEKKTSWLALKCNNNYAGAEY